VSQQEYIDGEYKVLQGDVITPQQRISELEQEINSLKGGVNTGALANILENPSALKTLFTLDEKQALNVASLITGSTSGLGRKYLTNLVGPELAGAIGGWLGGYISKRVMGK